MVSHAGNCVYCRSAPRYSSGGQLFGQTANWQYGTSTMSVPAGTNVGIGTTNSIFPFAVTEPVGFNSPAGGYAQISPNLDNRNGTTGSLHFKVMDFGTWMESPILNWNGSVGIGTTSPSTRLDVDGHLTLSGPRSIIFTMLVWTARRAVASSASAAPLKRY